MAEYIWIDSELQVRSKVRTLQAKEGGYSPSDLPIVRFQIQLYTVGRSFANSFVVEL